MPPRVSFFDFVGTRLVPSFQVKRVGRQNCLMTNSSKHPTRSFGSNNRCGPESSKEIREYVWGYQTRAFPSAIYREHYKLGVARTVLRQQPSTSHEARIMLGALCGFLAWAESTSPTLHPRPVEDVLRDDLIESYSLWAVASGKCSHRVAYNNKIKLLRLRRTQLVGAHPPDSGPSKCRSPRNTGDVSLGELEEIVDMVAKSDNQRWAAVLLYVLTRTGRMPKRLCRFDQLPPAEALPDRFMQMADRLAPLVQPDTLVADHVWLAFNRHLRKAGAASLHGKKIAALRRLEWLNAEVPVTVTTQLGLTNKELPHASDFSDGFGRTPRSFL